MQQITRHSRRRAARAGLSMKESSIGVLLIGALFVAAWLPGHTVNHPRAFGVVRVEAGQTLWELARANRPDGVSTAEMVSMITRLNGDEASILQPGSVLKIPTWPSESQATAVAMR